MQMMHSCTSTLAWFKHFKNFVELHRDEAEICTVVQKQQNLGSYLSSLSLKHSERVSHGIILVRLPQLVSYRDPPGMHAVRSLRSSQVFFLSCLAAFSITVMIWMLCCAKHMLLYNLSRARLVIYSFLFTLFQLLHICGVQDDPNCHSCKKTYMKHCWEKTL